MIKHFAWERVPTRAIPAETGLDTFVCHLQAHVSYLWSHLSEHVSTRFGLAGARTWPHGIFSGSLFSAQARP